MIRRIFQAAGYSGLGRFFSTLGNMLFVLAVSRNLDAAALGVYGLLFFFAQLFSGISPLGHPMYIAREVAHCRDEQGRLAVTLREGGSALLWGSGLSLLLWGVLLMAYGRLPADLLNLAVISGMLWGVEYLLVGILIGMERLAANALWHAVSLLLIVYCLFFQSIFPLTLQALFWIRIAATLVGLMGRLWAMAGLRRLISFSWRLSSYRESSFFWYSGWVFLASRQLDVLVISFFLPESVLGGYFLALRIYLSFGIVAEVLGVALIPFISRAYHDREERSLDWLFRMVMLGNFALGLPVAVAFYLGRSWLIAFFNPLLVADVVPLLACLALAIPFSLGNHLAGAFFSASDYQRERFFIHLWVIIATFAALIPLVIFCSVSGAIWVKMGSEIILYTILVYRFWKKLPMRKNEAALGLKEGEADRCLKSGEGV